jgi:LPS export ABC transporter protein LptC
MLSKQPQSFFLLILWLCTLILGCESKKDRSAIQTTYIGDNHPVQETWNGRVTFSDSGYVKAILEFAYSAEFKKGTQKDRQLSGGLKVDFLNRQGQITSVLTAKRAVIQPNNDMEAFEDVVITSNDCTKVETEYMKWMNKQKKIYSDKFVTITKPNEIIRGYGFESDQNMKNYRIFKVSGEAKVKDASNDQ